MFFSGGPYYQLMNKMLEVPGIFKQDYKGRQSAAEALGISTVDGKTVFRPQDSEFAKLLIPGSFALRSIKKSFEYLNKGDLYNWALSIGSAPLVNTDYAAKGVIPKLSEGVAEIFGGIGERSLSAISPRI